jgi:hypothetical protein
LFGPHNVFFFFNNKNNGHENTYKIRAILQILIN